MSMTLPLLKLMELWVNSIVVCCKNERKKSYKEMTLSRLPLRSMQVTQNLFSYLQVLNPFYVLQVFTLTLWLSQGYIEYSVAIIILSVLSIGLSVYDLRQVRTEIIVGFYLASGCTKSQTWFHWEQRVASLNISHNKAKSKGLLNLGSQKEGFRNVR